MKTWLQQATMAYALSAVTLAIVVLAVKPDAVAGVVRVIGGP